MPLEGRQLSYRHEGGSEVFRGLSLRVNPGEVVGLTGPSGCGKSSLGRLLAGYALPETGEITLGGQPLPARGYHPVQLVHQHPELAVNPRWKLRRTLHEGGTVEDARLAALGIEPRWLDRWPGELSGGELQRFCAARALGPGTRYLIADEMTTMLDAITQAQIWHAVLEQVERRGLGVLVVSHERPLLERLCSRILEFGALGGAGGQSSG